MSYVLPAVLLSFYVSSVHQCPDRASIYPCVCKNEEHTNRAEHFIAIYCNAIKTVDKLSRITRNLQDVFVDRFVIFNSEIGFLPNSAFKSIVIKEIFVRNTALGNFSDGDRSVFKDVEKSLQSLLLRKCSINSDMPIELIGQLPALTYLNLAGNNIEIIKDSWFESPQSKLQYLYLNQNKIRFIQEFAFTEMKNLVVLDLSENEIRYLQRSMFPKPFKNLAFLYLSYNEIAAFPADVFKEMPSLQRLYLDFNHISVIDANAWIPVWNTIKYLDLIGNNVTCDCQLQWITERNSPPSFYGECSSPQSLQGHRFSTLTRWDITEAPEMTDQHRCRY